MKRGGKILFFSRDPGGTNQLVALRDILQGGGSGAQRAALFDLLGLTAAPEIIVVAKDYAGKVWTNSHVAPENGDHIRREADVRALLAVHQPAQVITSTSHADDRTEQMVWAVAREQGVPTTVFLDSSHHLALRFTSDRGEVVRPDRVSATEATAIAPLRALGFDRSAIFISGDLHQDYIKSRAAGQVRGTCRETWAAADGECLILFASNYMQEMQALGIAFAVTEFEGLDYLIDLITTGAISAHVQGFNGPFRLIIRPHPKDRATKYAAYLEKSRAGFPIVVSDAGTPGEAILSADLVAGVGSSLLAEARTLAVPALELGPLVSRHKAR